MSVGRDEEAAMSTCGGQDRVCMGGNREFFGCVAVVRRVGTHSFCKSFYIVPLNNYIYIYINCL